MLRAVWILEQLSGLWLQQGHPEVLRVQTDIWRGVLPEFSVDVDKGEEGQECQKVTSFI